MTSFGPVAVAPGGKTLADLSPTELAGLANEHHQAVEANALDALRFVSAAYQFALLAGEALLAARDQTKRGAWCDWMDSNLHFSRSTARLYMRAATHRTEVERWVTEGGNGQLDALRITLMGLPWANVPEPHPEDLKPDALALSAVGKSTNAIAVELGLSYSVVRGWVDPQWLAAEKRRKREARDRTRRARQALREKERGLGVRRAGGTAAGAYALVRRALAELDTALGETKDHEQRAAFRSAIASLHRAEEHVVAALAIGRSEATA